jgi:OOP family OmpA-OmpF porin
MALLTSLLSMLDKRNVGAIAGALGESEQSVSRGLQSSIAAALGGMVTKADDPSTLSKILDMAPKTSGDTIWSQMTNSVSDPNSPLMSSGKRVLGTLFGGSEGAVTNALSADSGLRSGVMSTMMALAASLVTSFLSKRVHDEGLTMSGLGSLLQREGPAIRNALPASVSDLFWPRATTATAYSPVVAQSVQTESSSNRWILPLILLALIPGLFWLFNHARRPMPTQINAVEVPAPISGTANRALPDVGEIAKPKVHENLDLRFDTGSTKLKPESRAQLDSFASDLMADRDARIKVGGYTDNVGNHKHNLDLSQRRANRVMAILILKGISPSRVTSEGYGEENPVADNGTAEGRAQNRRVTVNTVE